MDNSMLMCVADGLQHLMHDFWGVLFCVVDAVHEGACGCVLHEEKDVVLVVEMGVKLNDVGVIQAVLYFEFVGELSEHVVIRYGWF